MVVKHLTRIHPFLRIDYAVYFDGQLRLVTDAVSVAKANSERTPGAGNVPWVHEYDRRILHFKGDGLDQFLGGTRDGVFGRCGIVLLYM